jgi:hypothetical protein
MAQAGNLASQTLLSLLRSSEGLNAALAAISLRENIRIPVLDEARIFSQNVPRDVAEKAQTFQYPVVYVYCDQVRNLLREKFRKFSGTARLNVEVRVSQDRLEGLERNVQLYVDAITEVLHRVQGSWGGGICYDGAYEVKFDGARLGGRSYIQSATVTLEVNVSLE